MAGRVCQRHSMYAFRVDIQGFDNAFFKKVSKIAMKVEVEEIREGGVLRPDKTPGHASVEDVTFDRGVTDDTSELDWFRIVADLQIDNGVDARECLEYKRNIQIIQLNRVGAEIRRYTLIQAFPNQIEIGEWDSDSTEKLVTTMTCSYDYPIVS